MQTRTAALVIERLPLSKLTPHPGNPRTHPEPGSSAWNLLKKSIEHDYFDPIVWNKRNGMLVSGHLRRKVLLESGFTEADCVVVDYDEPMHLARMISANRQVGEDDRALLRELAEQLDTGDFDMDLTGFDNLALEELMTAAAPPDEFGEVDENIETEHECPKCKYRWSGKSNAEA